MFISSNPQQIKTANMDTINSVVSIPAFYANRSIFITGGTGFMGKILIEKLLRSCPDVREIFVLLRPRKNLDVRKRLKEMLSSPAFDRVRKERPSDLEKVIPVEGDITASNDLGLSSVERQMLIDRVSIIFHVAAAVHFNISLKSAILSNIRATRDICVLAEEMKHLVALTYFGTAYSHTDKAVIDEVVYPLKIDWRQLIATAEALDENILNSFSHNHMCSKHVVENRHRCLDPYRSYYWYIDGFPNTYTFTKRIAEQVLTDYSAILPCIIIRPTIVISTLKEPVPGYIDTFNGPYSLFMLCGKGILRVIYCDEEIIQDHVPVDDSINVVLAATWKRGVTEFAADKALSVFNCANRKTNSATLAEQYEIGLSYFERRPYEYVMWPIHLTLTKSRVIYYILSFLYHLLPALLIDGVLMLCNRKPMMVKLQRKIYISNIALSHFMCNEWTFLAQNLITLSNNIPIENKDTFSFEMLSTKIDLEQFCINTLEGIRKYLLQEDRSRHEVNLKHYKRMCLIRNIARTIFLIITVWMMYRSDVFYWVFNLFSYILKNLIFRQIFM